MESILLCTCNSSLYQNKVSIKHILKYVNILSQFSVRTKLCLQLYTNKIIHLLPIKRKKKSKRCVSIKNPKTHFLLPKSVLVVRFVYIRKIKLIIITQKQTNAYEHVFFKLETSKRAKIVYK